jgi:hypothetical protein
MKRSAGRCQEDAVSEIIGSILLISIVVIAGSIIAIAIFSHPQAQKIPSVNAIITNQSQIVYIKHNGGDSLANGTYKVLVDGSDVTSAVNNTASNGAFSIGNLITYTKPGTNPPTSVQIVYTLGGSQVVVASYYFGMVTPVANVTPISPPNAPTFGSINPNYGPIAGGQNVTITGTNFVSGITVTIGGKAVTNLLVSSTTTLTATTPSNSAGAATVAITTGFGSASGINAYVYLNAPTFGSISPNSGPTAGGQTVTITGTNFVIGGTTVTIGGNATTSVSVSGSTSLTAVTPSGTAGAANVVVTTNGGSATGTNAYTYTNPPIVTGISPTSGPQGGGTTVTITGTNLSYPTAVNFGANPATILTNSSTQITVTSPAGSPGTVDVTVTTGGGTSATSSADQFTYIGAPTFISISPTTGPVAGGTFVTITGSGFSGTTSLLFNTTSATNITANANTITANVPTNQPAGVVNITITAPGGTVTANNAYTYGAGPVVISVSPSYGPLSSGPTVTITGTNFGSLNWVKFGSYLATILTNSSTAITVTPPSGSVGTVDVTVSTTYGTSTTSPADQYTYVAAPTVTGVSPSSGPLSGGSTVTITGTNLAYPTAVKFGGYLATILTNSSTTITVTPPSSVSGGTVDITVTTAGGTSATSSADQYTFSSLPTVTSVSPSSGPLSSGPTVTITGTSLAYPTSVTFGSYLATILTNSSTTITVTPPSGSAGTVNVQVTTAGGTSAISSADQYTYLAAPTFSGISPLSGPTSGSQSVTITGTNFVTGGTTVTIGGHAATSVSVSDSTTLTAVTPSGTAGAVNVVVTTNGGSATGTGAYTYLAAPTFISISPLSGPLAGSQSVTITGTNFVTGAGATTVTIGVSSATSVSVTDSGHLTAETPAGTAGYATVVVTTNGGSSTQGTNAYYYLGIPTVSGITPSPGPVAGGITVTITGTNFDTVTSSTTVTIGGKSTTGGVSVTDSGHLTTTTPSAPTGAGVQTVIVTTNGGSGSKSNAYDYCATVSWTSSTTWTVPANVSEADYLVVAGGGGGGYYGAGGGAGGFLTSTLAITPTNQLTVTIGSGGSGGTTSTPGTGGNGGNSVFSSITATGGGGGGSGITGGTKTGSTGGSGGGSTGNGNIGASPTAGQGNSGGAGSTSSTRFYGGGGGGASAAGNAASGATPGSGGAGTASSLSGSSVTYAGGGGGGGYSGSSGTGGTGGSGGGGTGGLGTTTGTGGTANTGGGGGGGGSSGGGGAGGSGFVCIRYY